MYADVASSITWLQAGAVTASKRQNAWVNTPERSQQSMIPICSNQMAGDILRCTKYMGWEKNKWRRKENCMFRNFKVIHHIWGMWYLSDRCKILVHLIVLLDSNKIKQKNKKFF